TTPIAYVKLAAYWADRVGKRELIGCQLSSPRGEYSEMEYNDDFTYIYANCVITTKGEFLI
ncbi:MAG: hypothetical protein LBU35_03750, partial [Holosporales bacterium]|nr:hypothetical protein [Holosporales bacterium]